MWAELNNEENGDILDELKDPEFATRTHGKRSTHSAGCHGPLCRKAERDASHQRYRRRRQAEGAVVTSFPPSEVRARDAFLGRVIEWHQDTKLFMAQ